MSVGSIEKNVGMLQIKNALDLVVVLVPSILGGLILILVVILILILCWRKKKREFIKKKNLENTTKGYNVRYIRRNGEHSLIKLSISSVIFETTE